MEKTNENKLSEKDQAAKEYFNSPFAMNFAMVA
jgi:hypothetical protein